MARRLSPLLVALLLALAAWPPTPAAAAADGGDQGDGGDATTAAPGEEHAHEHEHEPENEEAPAPSPAGKAPEAPEVPSSDEGQSSDGPADAAADKDGDADADADAAADAESPLIEKIDALPHQKAIAIGAAVLGGFAVVGPSSYVRFFLATIGSCVAGLMVGACYMYIKLPPDSHVFLDSVFALLSGEGVHHGDKGWTVGHQHLPAYALWGGFFLLGLLRWFLRWECGFYDVVEEVHMDNNGALRKPLLAPAAPPPPPPARDAV